MSESILCICEACAVLRSEDCHKELSQRYTGQYNSRMIDRTEIEAKGKEFEIHVANVERDYVFGWLLCGIFTVSGALQDQ